jgi:hypothetical protein
LLASGLYPLSTQPVLSFSVLSKPCLFAAKIWFLLGNGCDLGQGIKKEMKGLMHRHFGWRRRDVMRRVSRGTGLRLVDIFHFKIPRTIINCSPACGLPVSGRREASRLYGVLFNIF